jgi:hypothetical protein
LKISDTNSIRPAEQTPRLALARLLNSLRKFVGGDRFENLYKAIDSTISDLIEKDLFILDYGCGTMNFSLRLKEEGRISKFIGMDVFPNPDHTKNAGEIWKNYRQIPKDGISKSTENFDVVIVVDVLHHALEKDQTKILQSLADISRYIVIKDHFEYGLISRHLLRLADWYGNYAYGVSIPKRYFTKKRWTTLIENAGLRELKLKSNIKVHDGFFGLLISPRHHFISILQKSD